MIVRVLLFVASISCVVLVLLRPGLSDLVLVAGPAALASLILIVAPIGRRAGPQPPGPLFRPGSGPPPKYILIDGSNVIHWQDGPPDITSLRAVIDHLKALGFTPGVVFDANAGYKISERYQHDGALGRLLDLPTDQVMVVEKGTQADSILLAAARDLGAQIVTNDRFRDWATDHPDEAAPGNLIRGGFREGKLWLQMP